jgi:hypothetical protein
VINKLNFSVVKSIILSYYFTLLLTLDKKIVVNSYITFLRVFQTETLITATIFLSVLYFINKNKLSSLTKRESMIIKVFSSILAFIFVIGEDITHTQALFRGSLNRYSFVLFFILLIGYYLIFKYFLHLVWDKYNVYIKKFDIELNTFRLKIDRRKYFSLLTPFLLVRILAFILLYPGVTTYDSMVIIGEGLGIYPLTNSHPYLFTYTVSLFTKFGMKFLGGVGVGVAIFNFLTLVITTLIYVYVLYRIFELSNNKWLNRCLYLFYLLFPNFIIVSFTMYKDVYMVNALMLFFLCIIYILYQPAKFFENKNFLFMFIISFFGIYMMHRKAVIYIIVGILILFIFNKRYYKKILFYSLVSISFTLIINFIASSLIQPQESRKRYDYLAPRFQQLAAAVYYHPDSFSSEELAFYDSTLGLENNKKFVYYKADPIKDSMKNEQFEGREHEFFKLWFKGYLTHPKTYIDALLNLSVSYWYPYNFSDLTYMGNYYQVMYEDSSNVYGNTTSLDDGWKNQTKFKKLQEFYWNIHKTISYLPIFSIFYSAGLYTILLLIILMISLLRRDYKILGLIIICVSIILTCIYSPIVNYFRYSYVFMAIIPLLLPFLFLKRR